MNNLELIIKIKDFNHFDPLKDDNNLIPDSPGIYIIVLKTGCMLPEVGCKCIFNKILDKEVVYVGISSRSLKKRDYRQHFNGNAGRSTFRKSIGSLFGFKKIPRSINRDDGKTKFNEKDELFISNWMRNNLELYYLSHNNYDAIESLLIKELNPPLNISKNYHRQNLEFRNLLSKMRCSK